MDTKTDSNDAVRSNVPELSVSELAGAVKRTMEDSFSRVRVRGELSRVSLPSSGHMYSDLKDENAVINVVCWRGVLSRLSVKPEEGLEVIITGKMTTYPARSNYQLVIESMELAGEGALLKMLEERKKKLAAEGLFAPERKRPIPFLPRRIGVVTSPTGAVIRDILHRLNDRFPRPVLIWPVLVQGQGAAEQVTAAIEGFNKIEGDDRPDLLIIARGGGSLEDLMPFNEENVVRAIADSQIPTISAIGHETDTTLADFAADKRAPTPTGAAEMAVPRRADLLAQVLDDEKRLIGSIARYIDRALEKLRHAGERLGDPDKLWSVKAQSLDHLGHQLNSRFEKNLSGKAQKLAHAGSSLQSPKAVLREKSKMLSFHIQSMDKAVKRLVPDKERSLGQAVQMLGSLSPKNVLKRGYAIIYDENGMAQSRLNSLKSGQNIAIEMQDGRKQAQISDPEAAKRKSADQDSLF